MYTLENFVANNWIKGNGDETILYNAVTGKPIATTSSKGINFEEAVHYATTVGNPNLRVLSFQERGLLLKALAIHLQQHLPKFYELSYQTGATKADSWVDIEGGIGNLFSYASLRKKFPDTSFCTEGEHHNLGKQNSFMGHHILIPKEGVAIHINAFNFPVWGMLEKLAVNILAGMPAIVKPATVTSFVTEAVVKEIIASNILPKGALQLICGSAGNLLNYTTCQDVVTFTGSAKTGLLLKSHPQILANNVSFTMEADSLNCIVLGEDVTPNMPEWDIFIKEVRKEMTLKCGQRCTGVRRIFVPENKIDTVQDALSKALAQTVIGNPLNEKVRMGSLAGNNQRMEVKEQVQKLLAGSSIIYGSLDSSFNIVDANATEGAFISPILLQNSHPHKNIVTHEVEAFGPVSTLMPYTGIDDAIALSKLGKGSLCSSIITASQSIATKYVLGAGTYHGRILVLNNECAKENTGHGSPLPMLIHGGPGRAGGAEEMGGIRGVKHYMQRVAIQGSPNMLTTITQQYQPNASGKEDIVHPFRKYFEEIQIGDMLITGKRTITDADISNFANLSWDHFYAHTDATSLQDTLFEKPVAHGYFVLSAAAGLFVDGSKKGPVLLNYGIEELRFTKPVYAGSTIHVKFACKEKITQQKRNETDINKGIVKWYVEIIDQTNEIVAVATILTMIKTKQQ
jgi:oxepin-CoA hydrolase / 3-oxo-5,6-dehydrosuberyl-CoA semialdehyde dehydrogenase